MYSLLSTITYQSKFSVCILLPVQCDFTNLIYKPVYFWFPARNLMRKHDYEGRHSIENSQLDDLGLDKVFQDENCVAEGIETRFLLAISMVHGKRLSTL